MGIESHRSWRLRSVGKCTRKNDDDDWKGRKLCKGFSFTLSLWSPPEWESSSLYTHHPRRILEMIIITQYEYLYSGPDSKRKWRGASGQQRGRKGEEF